MDAKKTRPRIRKRADHGASGDDAAAGQRSGAEELDKECGWLQDKLSDIGRRLADSSRELVDEASNQAHQRPLAVFGVGFVAGVLVARALRR